jgi:effector-binding domain-containing protein
MTEKLGYQVIENLGDIEIRQYPPHILVSTNEPGSMSTAGNQSFRRLANYIFGGNNAGKSIAMTAPVMQAQKDEGFVTSFVMPASMSMSQMPSSSDQTLSFTEHPGGRFAAVSFSGLASQPLFDSKAKGLKEKLAARNIEVTGPAIYARFDGPWTPFFLRHNEVLIPLQG